MKQDLYQDSFGVSQYRYIFDLCPVNYTGPETSQALGLFSLWKQGKMLEPGGVGVQPAKYIDAMMFIEALWNQAERESIENIGKK